MDDGVDDGEQREGGGRNETHFVRRYDTYWDTFVGVSLPQRPVIAQTETPGGRRCTY